MHLYHHSFTELASKSKHIFFCVSKEIALLNEISSDIWVASLKWWIYSPISSQKARIIRSTARPRIFTSLSLYAYITRDSWEIIVLNASRCGFKCHLAANIRCGNERHWIKRKHVRSRASTLSLGMFLQHLTVNSIGPMRWEALKHLHIHLHCLSQWITTVFGKPHR